jgi:uncharacterized protein (TIGR03067 family)
MRIQTQAAVLLMLLLSVGGLVVAADNNRADMAKDELIRQDYELLTGTFTLVSGVVDGKPVPEEVRKKTILVTDHDKFTVSTGDEAGTSSRGTFTIDPTKTPKTADSLQDDGPDKGKTVLGIYEIIDDNHKRACWAPVGQPRPTEFTSEPGSGRILQIWDRKR